MTYHEHLCVSMVVCLILQAGTTKEGCFLEISISYAMLSAGAACDDPRLRDPKLLHKLSMGALTAESLPRATAVGGGLVQDVLKSWGQKEWDGLQLGSNDGFG